MAPTRRRQLPSIMAARLALRPAAALRRPVPAPTAGHHKGRTNKQARTDTHGLFWSRPQTLFFARETPYLLKKTQRKRERRSSRSRAMSMHSGERARHKRTMKARAPTKIVLRARAPTNCYYTTRAPLSTLSTSCRMNSKGVHQPQDSCERQTCTGAKATRTKGEAQRCNNGGTAPVCAERRLLGANRVRMGLS